MGVFSEFCHSSMGHWWDRNTTLEAGEHQKPLKGGEENQRAASGQYQCEERAKEGLCRAGY